MTSARAGRPYVDRPVIDGDRADEVARAAASRWGLPAPRLLRASMNRVYAAGEAILRVGHVNGRAESQLELARRLHSAGIAVPDPMRDEAFGEGDLVVTSWARVTGSGSVDWVSIGRAVARLHKESSDDLVPGDHPVADPRCFPWWDFDGLLGELAESIDTAALAAIQRVLDRHAGWADWSGERLVLCHGDIHPGNVVVGVDGPVLLDWDLLCLAPREWDLAAMSVWARNWGGDSAWFEDFGRGYGVEVDANRLRALGDLRDLAATLMAVRAGRRDTDRAAEARRRLDFWRDGTGPRWTSS